MPSWIETFSARAEKLRALLAPEFRERYGQFEGFRALFNETDVPGQLTGREPLHQSLYLWAKTALPIYILTMLGDRIALSPGERLGAFVQDTLRGPVLASLPYFDQRKVVSLLDRIGSMDEGSLVAYDQVLMLLVSACVLHQGFGLAA